VVDLPVNVKKVVVLEVFSTFLEKLQFESMNLCTRDWQNTILPIASDVGYIVD
jgi:hypothetical protein